MFFSEAVVPEKAEIVPNLYAHIVRILDSHL